MRLGFLGFLGLFQLPRAECHIPLAIHDSNMSLGKPHLGNLGNLVGIKQPTWSGEDVGKRAARTLRTRCAYQ